MAAPAGRSHPLAFLDGERHQVEAALADVVAREAAGLPRGIGDPVVYALSTTGKRLRPILCVVAYITARGERAPAALYRMATALEIVHTYSLVHDDLPCMDDDDLRRGRPTTHRVYGSPAAIVSGAVLLPIAMRTLDREAAELGLPLSIRGRLVAELARAAGAAGMVGGQLLDLEGEGRPCDAVTLESIHRRKTGALLACSLRIGALAGGAGAALLEALTRYGEAIGLAFQITDDLLDVEGTDADLGKIAGRDLALEKASYPALFGVDGARAQAREMVRAAKDALHGIESPELAALADYVLERRS